MREEEAKTASEMVAIEDSTPIALSATVDAPEELVLAASEEIPVSHIEAQEDFVHAIDQDALLEVPYDDRGREEQKSASNEEDDLYSVTGFTV